MIIWTCAALAQGAPSEDAAPVEPPVLEATEPSAQPPTTIVYTGASGGIGGGHYQVRSFGAWVEQLDLEVDAVQAAHGMFLQGDFALSTPDRTVRSTKDFLASSITCGERTRVSYRWTPMGAAFLPGPPVPGPTAYRSTCRNATGSSATLFGLTASEPSSWTPEDFEIRLGLWAETPSGTIHVVGRAPDEPARRFALLAEQIAAGSLWVDSGDFVDGASTVTEEALSLHRPTGFSALRRLGPTALVPGDNELIAGVSAFLQEADGLPYVVSNWQSEKHPLPKVVQIEQQGKRIAFVGILDPRSNLPGLEAAGVVLTAPRAALRQALAGVRADLVVLLTLAEVDTTDLGIDLVIGKQAPRGQTERIVWTRGLGGRLDADLGLSLPIDAVSTAAVDWEAGSTLVVPLRLQTNLLPDPEIQRAVSGVRLQHYPGIEEELLPADPEHPLRPIRTEDFENITCEAVRSHTDADVVLLGAYPERSSVPGGLTGILALERINTLDHVEVHWITGSRLKRLLTQAYGLIPVSCGAPLGARFPKARGRPLDDARLYRVVTTDHARLDPVLNGLLSEAHSPLLLDARQKVVTKNGEPLTLRTAVLSPLRALQADPEASPWDLLTPPKKPPMWILDARSLALRLERFQGVEDPVYATIPETLATSPSSFTLGGMADVELSYSSHSWLSAFRVQSTYTRLATDAAVQETADDLKISANGTIPALGFSAGLRWMPFAEVLLDSEFTPVEAEEGADPNLRQGDGYLLAGFSATRRGSLRRLRLGGFMLRDFSDFAKPMEFGGRLDAELRFTLGPSLYWTNAVDAYLYASTSEDDASDLRFKTTLDTRLSLPLARWLSISLYGQGFAFSGRIEETKDVAVAYSTGAAIDFAGAFELR